MAARSGDPGEIRRAMFEDGVVVVPGVVDEKLRAAAIRAINTELGKGIPKEEAERFANGVQFPSLMMRPSIVDLYNKSTAPAVVQDLLGPTHPIGGGQIALRFPGAMCLDHATYTPAPWWNQSWHLDGLTDEAQQWAKRGTVSNFSVLVGVVLADVPAPFMGNLVAFPGSHRMLETVFREQPEALQAVADRGEAGLPRNLPFRPAIQVTAKAGDLVLGHYQLAHSIAPNTSPHIRYVVYFRVHAKAHKPDTYRPESMRDIWADWDGMRTLVEEARQAGTLHLPITYRPVDPTLTAGMAAMGMNTSRPRTASEWGKYEGHRAEHRAFSQLSDETNPVYDKEKWSEARAGMCRLSDSRPEDFMLSLKASVCVALGDKDYLQPLQYYIDGEVYPRRAIAVAPDILAAHCLLVRILVGAGRHEDAVKAIEAVMELPTPSEAFSWTDGLIVDASQCAAKALDALNRDDDKGPLIRRVTERYPKLEPMLAQAGWNRERKQLWDEGKAMMDREPKDWPVGQRTFGRLAALEPRHFWTQLQAAACFTYGSGNAMALLKQGEAFARQAIDIDPASAGGYGVLARNLNLQGRHAEVVPLAAMLLNCRHEEVTKVLVLDTVRCLRIAYQKTNAPSHVFPETLAALGRVHTAWAADIDAVSREATCCVM